MMRKNLWDVRNFKKAAAVAKQRDFGPFRQRPKRVELSQKQQNRRDKGQN